MRALHQIAAVGFVVMTAIAAIYAYALLILRQR